MLRSSAMKKLVVFILFSFLISCYTDTLDNTYEYNYYNYTVTVSGDCSFITIHNNTNIENPGFIYNKLPINYIQTGIIKVRSGLTEPPSIERRIVKHTGDTSTISMQIEIEGQPIKNYSCSAPYCEIFN